MCESRTFSQMNYAGTANDRNAKVGKVSRQVPRTAAGKRSRRRRAHSDCREGELVSKLT